MKSIEKQIPTTLSELKKSYFQAQKEIETLKEEKSVLKAQNDYLFEQFKLSRQRQFGCSSEKNLLQNSLFDEAQAPIPEEAKEDAAEENETVTYKRKKRHGNAKRAPLPEHLPREECIYDIPESEKTCDCCGSQKICFGKDISEQLKVIPPKVVVIQHQRLKYCCKPCEGEVSIAPKPDLFLPKSIADTSLVAYTIIMKYADHLPLYRQEAIWKRNGVSLPRNTTCAWVMKAAELCEPLYEEIKRAILGCDYIQADETPLQVLNEKDRKNTQKSYMWVYRKATGKSLVLYNYQQTRQAKHPETFLENFAGHLQADAYPGYDWIRKVDRIVRIGCMAHARRPFAELVKISKKKKGLSHQALKMIGELYDIEEAIKDKNRDEKYKVRQERSKPLLNKIRAWLEENITRAPPKGKLGQGMNYMLRHFDQLSVYVQDGKLHIDNNWVENAIRPFALGKKNWLFAGNGRGAKAGAILYSLLISAKENELNQHTYLTFVFDRIRQCKTQADYQKLLPTNLTEKQHKTLAI